MGRRVTNGNGSIQPLEDKPKTRCRKWKLRVSVGRNGHGGYSQRTRRFHGTYSEAKQAMREFIAELEEAMPSREDTFAAYAERYHARRMEMGELSPRSLHAEEERIKAVKWFLGDCKVHDITPAMMEDVYAALAAGRGPSGRPLSGTSVQSIHKTMNPLFKKAVRDGVAMRNPLDMVQPPKSTTRERVPLTLEQMRAIVSSIDASDAMQLSILLAVTTGMRRSEVCALTWGDVEGRVIHVRNSMNEDGTLKPPKSGRGRDVVLPESASATLEGVRKPDGWPVVSRGAAEPVTPGALTQWWNRNKRCFEGCGDKRFHDLRHSYITQLSRSNVPVRVAQRLAGHSDPSVTLNVYTHADIADELAAADALDEALGCENA